MTGPGVAELQQAVLDTPNTVTRFLEALTGELVVADVVRQYPVVLGPENELGVPVGETATRRIAVLKGSATDRAYVYADSVFVPDRLPETARRRLEETREPIGRVLADHGLDPVRESLAHPDEFGPGPPDSATTLGSEVVWSRAYRLMIGGLPVFVIHEWFLHSVVDALGRHGRA